MKSFIKIPIKILTEKVRHRTDSIFYSGKNIAEAWVGNRLYVLTAAGEYKFNYHDKAGRFRTGTDKSPIVKKWKDHKIRYIDRNGWVDDWGWFGINIWRQTGNTRDTLKYVDSDPNVHTTYDEAIKAFIEFIEDDISHPTQWL